jgi:hypothetical protein
MAARAAVAVFRAQAPADLLVFRNLAATVELVIMPATAARAYNPEAAAAAGLVAL